MSEIKRYDFGWAGASKSPKMFESLHGRWVEWLDHFQTKKELEETKEKLRKALKWADATEKYATSLKNTTQTEREKWYANQLINAMDASKHNRDALVMLRADNKSLIAELEELQDAIMVADRMAVYNSPGVNEDDIAFIDSLTSDQLTRYAEVHDNAIEASRKRNKGKHNATI